MPAATFLTFLGGVLAGAGVNMLSALALGGTTVPLEWILIDSALWLASGAATVWLGLILGQVEAHVADIVTPSFTTASRQEVRRTKLAEVRRPLVISAALATLAIAAALAFAVLAFDSRDRSGPVGVEPQPGTSVTSPAPSDDRIARHVESN